MFRLIRLIRRLISLAVLLVIVGGAWGGYRVFSTAQSAHPIPSDVIVVLGAAQYNGRPSGVLETRLQVARTAYKEKFAPMILTVGSNLPGDRTTEAASSRQWLVDHGVGSKSVHSIPVGQDTLAETKGYVGYMRKIHAQRAILVTDKYHCLRAMTMARDLKIDVSCNPTSTSSLNYWIRETGAYLSYITLGRHGIQISDQIKGN